MEVECCVNSELLSWIIYLTVIMVIGIVVLLLVK
jgi:hypothetical protein